MRSKALLMSLAGVASMAAFASAANAADGCGAGWHRNYYGHCRPNHYDNDRVYYDDDSDATVVVTPEASRFYPGRGYFDGDRFYWHRRHMDGDWHYW